MVTNAFGYFTFSGVRGVVTVRVTAPGFEPQSRNLDVTADVTWSFKLARLLFASDSIVLGATIASAVDAGAPPCDPVNWDAWAPCQRFHFTAPATGRLVLLVTWQGISELDATLVTTGNSYVATSRPAATGIRLEGFVQGGHLYEIRVSSYYEGQSFQLRADLFP